MVKMYGKYTRQPWIPWDWDSPFLGDMSVFGGGGSVSIHGCVCLYLQTSSELNNDTCSRRGSLHVFQRAWIYDFIFTYICQKNAKCRSVCHMYWVFGCLEIIPWPFQAIPYTTKMVHSVCQPTRTRCSELFAQPDIKVRLPMPFEWLWLQGRET